MENRITEAMTHMIEQNKRATDTKQAVINAANSYESIKTAQKRTWTIQPWRRN